MNLAAVTLQIMQMLLVAIRGLYADRSQLILENLAYAELRISQVWGIHLTGLGVCWAMDAPRAGTHYPRSLGEFQSWFRTDADCLDYLEWLRWPAGFSCEDCG
ncbi:MAG: transposase, partial [Pseudomonadota bacterium]